MDKLTIGIIVDDHYLPTSGGGFSYYRTLLKAINEYDWDRELEIINIVFNANTLQQKILKKRTLLIDKSYIYSARYLYFKILYNIVYRAGKLRYKTTWLHAGAQIAKLRDANTEQLLAENRVDLVYYLKAEETSINYPFIATHWDVGHRSMYSFPEVALHGNYEVREHYYTSVLNKAFLIICESESGAKELLQFYAINAAKVKVMPIFSGDVVRQHVSEDAQAQTLQKYALETNRFFLYPAQFWAHKNHYNLLQALHLFIQEPGNESVKIVLCGSDKGNLGYIKELVKQLNIDAQVVLPGYVPDRELCVLYKNATALVMPTFLGPTNIPLLEAAELHCPVLCADLEGHREILQQGALYFNPASAVEIKDCMQTVKDNDAVRKKLIADAAHQVATSSFTIGKSLQLLEKFLLQAKPVRKTWGYTYGVLLCLLTCSILAA